MRVVAVVVTFDRLDLLRRLVERLESLEGLDRVLVLDNASRDGTGAWLAEHTAGQPAGQERVAARTLTTNTGGAGGFHDGLAWALEDGADLVWLMDDDGLPEPDALDTLLAHAGDLDFWGPVVVAEDDPARLVYPIRLPGGTRTVRDVATAEATATGDRLDDVVIPFNGVLVTRDLVERIGLPRAEFFIWGDDVEYLWRAQRAGARTATIVSARVLHPATDDLGTPMMAGRTTYNHTPSDLKAYCMARNNVVNLRDYRGWLFVLFFWVKTLWFYLFTHPQPSRLALSARAGWAGLRGDFTGHRRYLR